mgnify:FL=1
MHSIDRRLFSKGAGEGCTLDELQGADIPQLFSHLYLFRFAAQSVLLPEQLEAVSRRLEQLSRDLHRLSAEGKSK